MGRWRRDPRPVKSSGGTQVGFPPAPSKEAPSAAFDSARLPRHGSGQVSPCPDEACKNARRATGEWGRRVPQLRSLRHGAQGRRDLRFASRGRRAERDGRRKPQEGPPFQSFLAAGASSW